MKKEIEEVRIQSKKNSEEIEILKVMIKDILHLLDWSNGAFGAMWKGAVSNFTSWLKNGLISKPMKTVIKVLFVLGGFTIFFSPQIHALMSFFKFIGIKF